MPVVDVVNLSGKKVGQVELADAIFGAKVNQHLLHEASRWYLRGLRRGTHKVKEKSEVSGAGRKLWKQKGTGRARVGSIRSPLWRHGGTVHGPKPRDYSYALPEKMPAVVPDVETIAPAANPVKKEVAPKAATKKPAAAKKAAKPAKKKGKG